MAKSIKLKNNKYWDSESVSHNRKNLKTILNNLKLEFTGVYNLELVGGDTYQLELPENTIFVEPLLYSDGSRYSGGQFLVLGGHIHILQIQILILELLLVVMKVDWYRFQVTAIREQKLLVFEFII